MNMFMPNDFLNFNLSDRVYAATISNEILNAAIEASPVVYGNIDDGFNIIKTDRCNRKARLMFIEEIKKEPCKHEPVQQYVQNQWIDKFICKICKVELQAEWRPVNES